MNIDDPIKILITDDTPVITKLLADQIHQKYGDLVECLTAYSGKEALEILDREQDIAILISDLEMPEINGLELLSSACEKYPDMLRILLSGYADLENLTSALNECGICSFITKPWKNSQLMIIIDSAINKIQLYRENIILQESQDKSFFEILNVLTDIISELSPELSVYSRDVAALSVRIANELKLPDEQTQNIEIAAMLHPIGLLGMPREIFTTHPRQLAGELRTIYMQYPEISCEMLKATPRLEEVRNIIRAHQENVDGSGFLKLKRKDFPLESRILRIATFYEAAVGLRNSDKTETISQMNRRAGLWFDKTCMQAFIRVITKEMGSLVIPISVKDLKVGMRLGKNIYSKSKHMLLAEGATITNLNLKRLLIYNAHDPIEEVFIVVEN